MCVRVVKIYLHIKIHVLAAQPELSLSHTNVPVYTYCLVQDIFSYRTTCLMFDCLCVQDSRMHYKVVAIITLNSVYISCIYGLLALTVLRVAMSFKTKLLVVLKLSFLDYFMFYC